MPTPAERQALLFFAAIAALGVGVNAWRAVGGQAVVAGSRTELAAQIARVDSAVASSPSREFKASQRNQGRPKRRTITLGLPSLSPSPSGSALRRPPSAIHPPPAAIDLDTASAVLIESLPRIGPALAARIVANRDSFGAFGSLEGLGRVRGIGPALTKALKDFVLFSGVPGPAAPASGAKGRRRRPMP